MSEEIKEKQPGLFGKVDELRNTLEEEMTIISSQIDRAVSSIENLEIKVDALKKRKASLYEMVKAVKNKEIVLGEGEAEETEEAFLDTGNHTELGEKAPSEAL